MADDDFLGRFDFPIMQRLEELPSDATRAVWREDFALTQVFSFIHPVPFSCSLRWFRSVSILCACMWRFVIALSEGHVLLKRRWLPVKSERRSLQRL